MAPVSHPDLVRERLLGRRPTDTRRAWLVFLVITAIGGFLRLFQLGRPNTIVFDETYYVKQAASMLKAGIELKAKQTPLPDPLFSQGKTDVFTNEADFVVHPPLGKWVIAAGEWVFGAGDSFGWRFSSAVMGTLSILLICFVARRMFGSTLLGAIAGVLLAFDGHHFVQSRTALLDVGVMFWTFAAFWALLADRDRTRRIMADRVESLRAAGRSEQLTRGLYLGVRPWRMLAAVFLGMALGTKWSAGFFLAVFGIMSVLWDAQARRIIRERTWLRNSVLRDAIPDGLRMSIVALGVYLLGWTGWFLSDNGYNRHWAEDKTAATGFGWVPTALRSLWHYHVEMYDAARRITSTHPYMSNPWSWMVQGRPTSYYYEGPKRGEQGCTVDQCSKAITSVGTPTIWWLATIALAILVFCWLLKRDWRAGAILAGIAAGWLPWFMYQDRTIFTFYAVAFVPYVVLACTYVAGLALGSPGASFARRRAGLIAVGTYVAVTVACFAFFYPVYTARVIPYNDWHLHMWFPSWV